MFQPVTARPDFVAQEHELLREWEARRTFARLRAQNEGGPRWSFLDGPITANNPMGVHHAWGRAYKDLYQRYHAMLGQDQRYQNGFDCQGLWVEVNVERDLGFTSKRDIEAYGIDRFVTLCKQRVLTFAARQTEQSIRLGMWMDWNDPAELRRLHDLLGSDPTAITTIQGPRGPVTDTVEMLVGRLGLPETGGSYFTFSNENNDLIWGFLAECHKRGWLYKGHDTMPWCPRCGTGLSQMEMNEGYQDREDPGLTVRFPLVDRPGEALLVWTTTPWTLTSNVAAAVGEDLRYVRVRQGEDRFWLGKGTLKTALQGPYTIEEEVPGSALAGWRYTGPYDALPAVRAAFDDQGYEHRVVAWDEVGEDEGTGIVHIAPGCGAEDYQLGKAIGLPVIGPIDEDGRYLAGFDWLTGLEAPAVAERIVDDLHQRGFFYHLEPYSHRYPHCWRCSTPLLFRLVDEWFISMGEVYDQPRETLTPEQVDASLRYQIMDVVDRIRWIPDFGLRAGARLAPEHARLDDQQEALLGPGAADLRLHRVRHGRRDRRARGAAGAGGRGLGPLRGPHAAPSVDRRGQDRLSVVRRPGRADPGRRQPVAGRGHRAVLHDALPRGPGLLGEVVPGRLHHRELPRPVPQLVLLDARDVDRPQAHGAVPDDLRLRARVRRGRAPDAQELGQRHRVRRGRRPDGRRRHALDVREGPARGQHPVRLARRRRGAPRAARPVERVRVLRHLRAPRLLDADARDRRGDRGGGRVVAGPRSLDPVACRRARGPRRGAPRRLRRGGCDARAQRVHGRPVHLVPAPVAGPDARRRRPRGPGGGLRDAPRRPHEPQPDHGADPAVPVRDDVPQPRRRGRSRSCPTAST